MMASFKSVTRETYPIECLSKALLTLESLFHNIRILLVNRQESLDVGCRILSHRYQGRT